METTVIAEIGERITVKNFMLKEGYNAFFKSVRENANGYPYITFIRQGPKGTEAENLYFSKNFSDSVAEGTDVLGLFKSGNVKVAQIIYKDGRPTRWKLVSADSGGYADISDLD